MSKNKNIESDYKRTTTQDVDTSFLSDTSIEVVRRDRKTKVPEFVLFDFDGTLSLVREGWPEVMVPMMVEFLQATPTDESEQALSDLAYRFVMELNGKQTIYQMIRLAEEVKARGGKPEDPADYKHEYHRRLMVRIEGRREKLRSGEVPASEMVVPGSHDLLDNLTSRGAKLYLASGTDQNYVREEVELLGLSKYFGEHVYGAVDDYKAFSKAQVIEQILTQHQVDPTSLLGFGDGYVEIENIKSAGGTAVAVASDESGKSGKPDPWKRDRLLGVGADLVVPDFREHAELIRYLWNEA